MRRVIWLWSMSLVVMAVGALAAPHDAKAAMTPFWYCELDIFSGGPTEQCPYQNAFGEFLCGMCKYDCADVNEEADPGTCSLNASGERGCVYSSGCEEFAPGLDCEEEDFFASNQHYLLLCTEQ